MVLMPSLLPLALVAIGLWFNYAHRFVMCFLLGCGWALLHQWWTAPSLLANLPREITLTGVIASIPKKIETKTQFEFVMTKPVAGRVLLTCYDHCPTLQVGESWRVTAMLREPRQYRNPGGFDYLGFLRSKHISWTGFTKRDSFAREQLPISLDLRWFKWRYSLSKALETPRLNEESRGVVEALALGMTSHLSQDMWGLFRRTGTTHLMVISGAHIGLVAGFIFHAVHKIWRYCGRWSARFPAMRIARYIGFLGALLYAFIAGFAVPAERATVAFLVLSLRYFLPIYFTPGQAWCAALWFVLLFEPHVVLQPGLYLSFIAVAILVATNRRFFKYGSFKKMLFLQAACLLGLMPLTLYWFGYGSLNGFFANLLAIPWVSFILIPLSLISVFCHLPFLFLLENYATHGLITYLNWIDHFSSINFTHVFANSFSPILMMFVMGIAFFIPLRSLRGILILLFISTWMPVRLWLKSGEAEVNVLDVGQGLSVVVRTAHHVLVYDTGMKFYRGSDIGQLVLIPFLRKSEINYLDKVVISHPDLDHRGGLKSLEKAFQIGELLVDDTKNDVRAKNCHRVVPWVWDGVKFEFFPINLSSKSRNNHSCVLKVTGKHAQILLTGDIESPAEFYLVSHYAKALRSKILLVPHHGSKTSSSRLFLKTVSPVLAWVSYGADNRYHFPHEAAMQHYAEQEILVHSTREFGKLTTVI